MSTAACLRGDKRLGGTAIDFNAVDFTSQLRIPKLGFFCVVGNTISIQLRVMADSAAFSVELVQKNADGTQSVINSALVDTGSQGPAVLVLFSENTEDTANTRCFLRFKADDWVGTTVTVRSF